MRRPAGGGRLRGEPPERQHHRLEGAQGSHYVPAWPEYLVTLMLVAIGFAVFGLAVKYLPVYPREEESPEPVAAPALQPAMAARM